MDRARRMFGVIAVGAVRVGNERKTGEDRRNDDRGSSENREKFSHPGLVGHGGIVMLSNDTVKLPGKIKNGFKAAVFAQSRKIVEQRP